MSLPTRVARTYSDPFDGFAREFDVLNRFFNGNQTDGRRLAPWGVDVHENGDVLVVEAELPGFKKDEVDISLENQTLTIAAERNVEQKPDAGDASYLLKERRYSRFLRSFTLPPTVDEKSVEAKLDSGVLTVTLRKREESKPRKITVG